MRFPFRRFSVALWFFASLWAVVLLWLAVQTEPFVPQASFIHIQGDYYNRLVDGFQQGRLSMDIESTFTPADKEALAAGKPPFVLDAAFYQGRYYLYYGVTPAVVLLWPYTALTGRDLSLDAACLFFALLGFAASVGWIARLASRQRADWGVAAAFNAAGLLAVVPGLFFLVRRSSFYDLPVVSGYAFIVLTCVVLGRAVERGRSREWLLAGLLWGLAVGCRANLLLFGLCFPWLALAASSSRREGVRSLAWSVLGAGVPGAFLALYNFQRFGSIFDFGFSYGMNSFFTTGHPLVSPTFLWTNLHAYLLAPPTFAPWFPFVFPLAGLRLPALYSNAEAMSGFAGVSLLAGVILFALVWRGRREPAVSVVPRTFLWALGVYAVLELLFTCLLGIRAYRYATDFLTPVALLLALGSCRLWAAPSVGARWTRHGVNLLLVGVALVSVLGAVQQFNRFEYLRTKAFAWWSQTLNPSFRTLTLLSGSSLGDATMTLTFSKPEKAVIVPLLRTGRPSAYDELQVTLYPEGKVDYRFFHSGFGGPSSGLLPIEWGRPYRAQVRMGSFFPPDDDPYFRHATPTDVFEKKTRAALKIDQALVINRQMRFHASAPWVRQLVLPSDQVESAAVRITDLAFAEDESAFVSVAPPSVYRFDLRLDPVRAVRSQPVLCLGLSGEGNLLLIEPLATGDCRFAVDVWGYGLLYGKPFPLNADGITRIEVVVGPLLEERLLTSTERAPLKNQLLVRANGKSVGQFALNQHRATVRVVEVGTNGAGFSSAEPVFNGELKPVETTASESEALIEAVASEVRDQAPVAFP